jgi:predicted permease
MGIFAADIRYALRTMRANPAFTAVAVAALALGIGANTAIFTVVNSVLLRPLPYPEPDRMMQLGRQFPDGYGRAASTPKYMAWRQNQAFDGLAVYGMSAPGVTIGSGDRPEQARSLAVSAEYFKVFGVSPVMGRTFTPEEDLPGGASLVVIGYGFWQSRLGASPQVIGRTIWIDSKPATIIGVLPNGFESDPPAEVWLPIRVDPASTNQGHYLRVAGRLKPGVTLAGARAEMKIAGERFRAANPKWIGKNESVAVVPMQEFMTGDVKPALLILLGAVAFVLLIACANVANLLLARAAVRQRELAIRAAIGAGRRRLIRQLLTESVMLALLGGIFGFALGAAGVRGLLLLAPGNIPRLTSEDSLHAAIPLLDPPVALFTLGVALLTGIVFGLYPALQTSKSDLASALKETSGRSGTSRKQNRARSALVVVEVALAIVLVIGASLLIRTFVGLRSVKPGIETRNVLTFETSLTGAHYDSTAKVDDLVTQAVRRIGSLPGVQAAGASLVLPLGGARIDLPFNIMGSPPAAGSQYNGNEQWRSISPQYFDVFQIPLRRGRVFRETDARHSAPVTIVSESFARKHFPNEDALGQVLLIGKGLGPALDDAPRQIVGVVAGVRDVGLSEGEAPVMYVPQSQVPDAVTKLVNGVGPLSWEVRSAADPNALRAAIAREIRSLDGSLAVNQFRPMAQVISDSISRESFNTLLLGIFAAIALALAAIGVYGLMSYTVQQRTQEIGIRMALGAGRSEMLRLVLKQGMALAGAGVVLGLAMSYALTRLLSKLLFGVKATDPLTFGGVAAFLIVVAFLATYIPARRASAIQPYEALRAQ